MSENLSYWNGYQLQFTPSNSITDYSKYKWALVAAFYNNKTILGYTAGRGWCIPSGHIETDESCEEAARREAFEEIGVEFVEWMQIGELKLVKEDKITWACVFAGNVKLIPEISEGKMLVTQQELPQVYFDWNPVFQQIFDRAFELASSWRTSDGKR